MRESLHAFDDRDVFLALACVLLGFGTLMVHSASVTSWPTDFEEVYLSRHVLFLGIAVVCGAACAAAPAGFWFRAAPWLFAGSAALLVAVLLPGVGTRTNGAQRWLRYHALCVQPSELVKISLPLLLCRTLCLKRHCLGHWRRGTLPLLWPGGVVVPLIVLQPDLGTAVFLAGSCGIALFLGGWPLRNFLIAGAVAVPLGAGVLALKPYQWERVRGFVATWSDFDQAPYQVKQSLVSLGAGGILGAGLGNGWQKLSFLPEANTDFVLAVVGEELGLIGTLGLVGLWLGLFVSGLRLLRRLPRDCFPFLAAATLLVELVLQAALNSAVVTSLVPPKGISLPLVSYGGSNLLVSVAMLGIIVGLSRAGPARAATGSGLGASPA